LNAKVMNQSIRAFIAFPLPELIATRIADIQERLKSYRLPVRWVRPENVHLTLKFLGEISVSTIDGIGEVIEDTVRECSPLILYTKGLGVFPGIKKPRILWTGISGDINPLSEIQANLEINMEKKGFSKENRPFKSHLTLGRVKGDIHPEKLFDILRSFSDFTSGSFEAKELILYQSELQPSGALYTKLQTVYMDGPRKVRV
jgi:RNA 2',3'-cyclic 3'-phosphodiesterase